MAKHTDTESALDEIREKVNANMEDGNQGISVNMSFKKEPRYDLANPFVFVFLDQFLQIMDQYSLTRTEIKMVFQILKYMQFGNLISMSFSKLMRDIGIDRSNGSKIIKRLKEAKLIINDDGNLYFNPHIITKGLRVKDLDPDMIDYAAEQLEEIGVAPNILTRKIKSKQKQKAKKAD